MGQINSLELTDVLVVVVRYFGGIKLGTSGLIAAYREAARLALEDAGRLECRQQRKLTVQFDYASADKVMRIVKNAEIRILEKTFDNMCSVTIEFPLDLEDEISGKLGNIAGAVLSTSE